MARPPIHYDDPTIGRLTEIAKKRMGPAQQTKRAAEKYAYAICDALGLPHTEITIGPPKDPQRAAQKALTQYQGHVEKIGDFCRLSIEFEDPALIPAIQELMSLTKGGKPKHSAIKKLHSSSDIGFKKPPRDHFMNPKRWGYLVMFLQLETQLSKGNPTRFEIQIVPKGMREVYKQSHALYETIREEIERTEKEFGSIDRALATDQKRLEKSQKPIISDQAKSVLQKMIDLHETRAKELGLTRYIGQFRSLHLNEAEIKSYADLIEEDITSVYGKPDTEIRTEWQKEWEEALAAYEEIFKEPPAPYIIGDLPPAPEDP